MNIPLGVAAVVACLGVLACDDDETTGSSNAPLDIVAILAGPDVRPTPVNTNAAGTATIHVTTGTSDFYDPSDPHAANFTYSITVSGLSGPATSAHIHGPSEPDDVEDVLVTMTLTSQQTGGLISNGTFLGTENSQVSGDSLVVLLTNGRAYVDIHTAANPDGEIRGQAFPLNASRVAPSVRR